MITAHARGTYALIDLDAISFNIGVFRRAIGESVSLMAVVKADGYGHGALAVARTAVSAGADWLGVAAAEEGEELRQGGIELPILILGPSSFEQVGIAVAHGLDVTLFEHSTWEALRHWGAKFGMAPRVHLKVDTGMGRVGVKPGEVADVWIERLKSGEVVWQGLMSHLASSDSDIESTRQQLEVFLDVIESMRSRSIGLPPLLHLANSAATLRFPGTHFNLVRVGLGLYGAPPYPGADTLRAAMSLHSQVAFVKEVPPGTPVGYGSTYVTETACQLVTIPVGYADGYRRAFSNRGAVLLSGRRCPVVGRVSMDQIVVVVPQDVGVYVGDPVVLMGEDGDQVISADEMADWADTISYEILTGVGPRVPRVYAHGE